MYVLLRLAASNRAGREMIASRMLFRRIVTERRCSSHLGKLVVGDVIEWRLCLPFLWPTPKPNLRTGQPLITAVREVFIGKPAWSRGPLAQHQQMPRPRWRRGTEGGTMLGLQLQCRCKRQRVVTRRWCQSGPCNSEQPCNSQNNHSGG